MITVDGKPAIDFDGVNDRMGSQTASGSSIFAVFAPDSFGFEYLFVNGDEGRLSVSSSTSWTANAGSTTANTFSVSKTAGDNSLYNVYNSGSGFTGRLDGSQVFSNSNTGTSGVLLDNIGGPSWGPYDGKVQEVISWGGGQPSNIPAIETNINTYYDIY